MRPKTVKDIGELLDDPEKFNTLLDDVRNEAYSMSVEHILRTLPNLIKSLNGFYSAIDAEVVSFFKKNPKFKKVKEVFRTRLVLNGTKKPNLSARELLEETAKEVEKELGI